MTYKQAIQVTDNATDMMKIPCVKECRKDRYNNDELYYVVYTWENLWYTRYAFIGDWLVETEGWQVFSDDMWNEIKDK